MREIGILVNSGCESRWGNKGFIILYVSCRWIMEINGFCCVIIECIFLSYLNGKLDCSVCSNVIVFVVILFRILIMNK